MNKTSSGLIILTLACSILFTTARINVARASPAIFIRSNGLVEPPTSAIQRVGDLYALTANISDEIIIQRSNIIIDGNGYALNGVGIGVGFTIDQVNNVTIRKTRIINFEFGISLDISNNNNITGNYIQSRALYGMHGVQLTDSSYNIIAKNTIAGNATAIVQTNGIECLSSSTFNRIFENNITDTYFGATFDGASNYNTFHNNTLRRNSFGVWFRLTSLNTISENMMTGSQWSIYLSSSFNNTIIGNTIANNTFGGIYFLPTSNNNTISGNTLINNPYGLQIVNSSNNRIAQNNFIDNSIHVNPPSFSIYSNLFDDDYPVGGNFWDNYVGVDFYSGAGRNVTGSDGIGDTSHAVDANNNDTYPLVGRFSSFQPFPDRRVNTISNSTIEDFAYFNDNGTIKMRVTNSSQTQLSGFIRVTIQKALIGPPYTILIDNGQTVPLVLNGTLYDNATHRWIYFAYPHSTHEISIQGIPPDITSPSISILSPQPKAYNTRDVPLTFTVNEPASWIGYSLNGQGNATISGNTTLTSLTDGPHTIAVYANDTAGNFGNSTTINFSVDATPPFIQILSPQNATYNARGVPLTFTISETTAWIGYSLDSTANLSISGNTTITNLSNGTHAVAIYANDTLGNMGYSERTYFTILVTSNDTSPPIITIVSPENKTYTTTQDTIDIPLTFTVNEPATWMAYSLDNRPNVTVTGNITLTNLPIGFHSITVYALDAVGNAGASEKRVFTIEATEEPPPTPFPPTWVIITISAIIIAVIAILVYFFRIRRKA
ncbi:MAG TPA: NosD domain-containing protein [Candidatus Bathyarchaeia archaeon]|nr:NosD domain-containing protein [Candidatus Bathyarchaeia archaeon]